jgi:hypothetical protein
MYLKVEPMLKKSSAPPLHVFQLTTCTNPLPLLPALHFSNAMKAYGGVHVHTRLILWVSSQLHAPSA